MGIPQRYRRIRSAFAEKLIPTSYLLEEKAEWERQLECARNGEYENNEEVIADATEEIAKYNEALARRQEQAKQKQERGES